MTGLVAGLMIGLIIRIFWRQLIVAAAWCAALAVCYVLLRFAPSLGVSVGWINSFYGATVMGLIVGVFLSWRLVVNWLVEQDYQRDVERARGTADKRRV